MPFSLVPYNGTASGEQLEMLHACGKVTLNGLLERFGWMFYLITPNSSTFLDYENVPNYEVQLFPIFTLFIFVEQMVRRFQKKRFSRPSDFLVNTGSGIFFTIARVLLLGVVMKVFYFFYNYRLVDLEPQALSTWLFSLLLIEFTFYWIHRSLHEINIFWAGHQFHHNAVELDVTTTVRDSVVDLVIYEFFPAPLALIIPPPILLVHMQFSLFYQIWLHNEVIGHLGPLEYLINTPRQHRVHHGKNPYCIDKNYGALLMIWDRIFGTYQAEEEKIVFGTTSKGYETFDAVTLNFYYFYDVVWEKFRKMDNWSDKMKVLFYGPGWAPGKPRTGLLSDIPKVDPDEPIERYDRKIPFWESYYVLLHLALIALGYFLLTDNPQVGHLPLNALYLMLYLLLAITAFGAIFDRRPIAPLVESVRCLLYFPFEAYLLIPWIESMALSPHLLAFIHLYLMGVRLLHLASILLWMVLWLRETLRLLGWSRVYPSHKTVTLKKEESSCLGDSPYTHNNLSLNQPNAWQTSLYALSFIMGLVFLFFIFGLRYDECAQLLTLSPAYT